MLNNFLVSLPLMTGTRAGMIVSAFLPMVKADFMVSLLLAMASFLVGMMVAIAVTLVRIIPSGGTAREALLKLMKTYISIIRGTPLLVQFVIVFYGLPFVDISIDSIPAATTGFSLSVGAYASETICAAILSMPRGRQETGFSVSMTYMRTPRRIIVPQTFRATIPPLSNEFIDSFKNTSLAIVVMVTGLLRAAQETTSRTHSFLSVYVETALAH